MSGPYDLELDKFAKETATNAQSEYSHFDASYRVQVKCTTLGKQWTFTVSCSAELEYHLNYVRGELNTERGIYYTNVLVKQKDALGSYMNPMSTYTLDYSSLYYPSTTAIPYPPISSTTTVSPNEKYNEDSRTMAEKYLEAYNRGQEEKKKAELEQAAKKAAEKAERNKKYDGMKDYGVF